jgi:hypothetical protein
MGKTRPKLTVAQILRWADAHRRRTGEWPTCRSGVIPGAPGESWAKADEALRCGRRGLPVGGSLALLLSERRGRRTRVALPPLTEAQILAWADAHHRQTGRWPSTSSGPVAGVAGEHWMTINSALRDGLRGLPGGDSLSRLLVRHGRRRGPDGPNAWTAEEDELLRRLSPAEAARRTGRDLRSVYQRRHRLRLPDARKRYRCTVAAPAPRIAPPASEHGSKRPAGRQGCPRGVCMCRTARPAGGRCETHPGADAMGMAKPPLSVALILRWADAHQKHIGRWPGPESGPVRAAPGENWQAVNQALYKGLRGLPGGDSLARLLVRRGRRTALWARSGPSGWTPAEDELVRTLRPKEAARHTGRPLSAVYMRRSRLRLPDARKRE